MIRRLSICFSAMIFTLAALAGEDSEREGGILGTGIVGAITQLGSIFVNGQRIAYPSNMNVHSILGNRLADDLVPGETVIVEASHNKGIWNANRITHYLPAVGPATLATNSDLSVLGSHIVTPPDTTFIGFGENRQPATGDWIAVNGLWRDKEIVATQIIKIDPLPEAILMGTYDQGARKNSFFVGGTSVQGLEIHHAKIGDALTVTGIPRKHSLDVRTVTLGLFSQPLNTVLMEGYLSKPDATGRYTIHGSGIISYVGDDKTKMSFDRGIFCTQGTKETAIQPVITDLPEEKSLRRQSLESIGASIAQRCPM
ncbi:MAG: DUF5666 domain-containing protein [Stappiaceae bacterium]